jgi:Tol biopolymer transport system component
VHDWVGESTIGPGVDPTIPGSQGLIVYRANDPGVTQQTDIHLAVVTVDIDGSIVVDPATIEPLALPGQQGMPVISPDGLQIAFYDGASASSGEALSVVEIDGSAGFSFGMVQTLLLGGFAEFRLRPTWSPDSKWISFTWGPDLTNRRDPFEIARIRWDGSEFTNMTNSNNHETYSHWNPAWDPAGP